MFFFCIESIKVFCSFFFDRINKSFLFFFYRIKNSFLFFFFGFWIELIKVFFIESINFFFSFFDRIKKKFFFLDRINIFFVLFLGDRINKSFLFLFLESIKVFCSILEELHSHPSKATKSTKGWQNMQISNFLFSSAVFPQIAF